MRNASGSGCCGAKSAKAEEQAGKAGCEENTGCCRAGEAPERTDTEAAAAASAAGPAAGRERKGCC